MTSKYKVKDLKKLLESGDFIYEYTTLISDKLRAIYVVFGYTHMTGDFNEAQNTIDQLMGYVYKGLSEGKKEVQVQTAGLMVEGWVDEDGYVNLDYYFNLA